MKCAEKECIDQKSMNLMEEFEQIRELAEKAVCDNKVNTKLIE